MTSDTVHSMGFGRWASLQYESGNLSIFIYSKFKKKNFLCGAISTDKKSRNGLMFRFVEHLFVLTQLFNYLFKQIHSRLIRSDFMFYVIEN